jgi:hypothetical protein
MTHLGTRISTLLTVHSDDQMICTKMTFQQYCDSRTTRKIRVRIMSSTTGKYGKETLHRDGPDRLKLPGDQIIFENRQYHL